MRFKIGDIVRLKRRELWGIKGVDSDTGKGTIVRIEGNVIFLSEENSPFHYEHELEPFMSEPQSKGIKYDENKPDYSLIPKVALDLCARTLMYGAEKYGRYNWRGGMNWCRLSAAAQRHIKAWEEGEDSDPETNISHLAHAINNLMFLLEYANKNLGTDNRYKGE